MIDLDCMKVTDEVLQELERALVIDLVIIDDIYTILN